MKLQKIISGGQTGVDRAALDFALENKFPCGGWCPRGRKAEDGPIDRRYPLKESSSENYEERTLWNVRDSDGTLILTFGRPTAGTAMTINLARELGKPCFVIDLRKDFKKSGFRNWIKENKIKTLNVAGPRESNFPGESYKKSKETLGKLIG